MGPARQVAGPMVFFRPTMGRAASLATTSPACQAESSGRVRTLWRLVLLAGFPLSRSVPHPIDLLPRAAIPGEAYRLACVEAQVVGMLAPARGR
jgi:hypothetical protein